MIDMETLGYFIYMDESEKHTEDKNRSSENETLQEAEEASPKKKAPQ